MTVNKETKRNQTKTRTLYTHRLRDKYKQNNIYAVKVLDIYGDVGTE